MRIVADEMDKELFISRAEEKNVAREILARLPAVRLRR
jgi:hypothetical protein